MSPASLLTSASSSGAPSRCREATVAFCAFVRGYSCGLQFRIFTGFLSSCVCNRRHSIFSCKGANATRAHPLFYTPSHRGCQSRFSLNSRLAGPARAGEISEKNSLVYDYIYPFGGKIYAIYYCRERSVKGVGSNFTVTRARLTQEI
jgi:hypothetical protein